MIDRVKKLWWGGYQYLRNWPCARKLLRSGYLHQVGYFRSCRERLPVDAYGNPLPWYSYSAIHFLETRINALDLAAALKVHEYGTGYSTLRWSKRCETLHCCEHSEEWFNVMRKSVPDNVTLALIKEDRLSEYVESAGGGPHKHDIIIVDGIARNECAYNATAAISGRGVIILDDSQRDEYREGVSHIIRNGFKRLDFVGLGPITTNRQSTTIFYREGNCLVI